MSKAISGGKEVVRKIGYLQVLKLVMCDKISDQKIV